MQLKQVEKLKELELKAAERSARLEERRHYSKIIDRFKSNAEVLSTKVVSLTSNMVTSEVQSCQCFHPAQDNFSHECTYDSKKA